MSKTVLPVSPNMIVSYFSDNSGLVITDTLQNKSVAVFPEEIKNLIEVLTKILKEHESR